MHPDLNQKTVLPGLFLRNLRTCKPASIWFGRVKYRSLPMSHLYAVGSDRSSPEVLCNWSCDCIWVEQGLVLRSALAHCLEVI